MLVNDYYGQSSQNIFLGNFDCENFWRETKGIRLPTIDLYNIKSITQNYDELFIFLACKKDILVLRRNPDDDFICYLRSLGVEIPRILTTSTDDDKKSISELILDDRNLINNLKQFVSKNKQKSIITNIVPYGVTSKEEKLAKLISAKLCSNSQTAGLINCKLTLRELTSQFDIIIPERLVCDGIEDLQHKGMEFAKKHGQIVLKELYGSSGSGLVKISDTMQFNKLIDHLKRFNQIEGKIILEKWYTSEVSYNHQYMIMDDTICSYAFSKQLINSSGKIVGSEFQEASQCLTSIKEKHAERSRLILNDILHIGYEGLVGFDSVICNNKLMFPVVDINCRINLSTIFCEILSRYFAANYACFFSKEYVLEEPISFATFIKKIGNTAYTSAKKEGIVILNFTSLNSNILRSKSKIGRAFYAVFARSKQKAIKIYEEAFSDEGIV